MTEFTVQFDNAIEPVRVPSGTLLTEAAKLAGLEIGQPCGGQGRCGRCVVRIDSGPIRRRSMLRLSSTDLELGYALACQTVVEGDVLVSVPPQERIERRLTTDRTAADVTVPVGYSFDRSQSIRRVFLELPPPSMDDQTDDWSRVQTALRRACGLSDFRPSLSLLRRMGEILRSGDWKVTAILDVPEPESGQGRLIDLRPGCEPEDRPIWGVAIDIGTTTVTLWLVDLLTGQVRAQASEYNGQIARGEDVISRIVYAGKGGGAEELRRLVLETIHSLLERACKRVTGTPAGGVWPEQVVKATIAGNSTMMHLLLGIPATNIRLAPFVTGVNHIPTLTAVDLGLNIHPDAVVDCLPGVASYVGADITAGVLFSGMEDAEGITLFMDVGTNGEIVLGSRDWLVTCACSAGPAFEGAGVVHGMRATLGAIDEVWINGDTCEPSYRTIGGVRPRGLCGSGLISLLAEMFTTGLIDKGGHLNFHLGTSRIRRGENGPEYVVAWGVETENGADLTITHTDIDNLLRAKAAIYAGYTVLADRVGFPLDSIERMIIGGSFGKYINVEKAIQIGLLPDLPWEWFVFLGNTAIQGAYRALLNRDDRQQITNIAGRMTYIELSADNTFYDAFMAAMFLPHTDVSRFPSVNGNTGTSRQVNTDMCKQVNI